MKNIDEGDNMKLYTEIIALCNYAAITKR